MINEKHTELLFNALKVVSQNATNLYDTLLGWEGSQIRHREFVIAARDDESLVWPRMLPPNPSAILNRENAGRVLSFSYMKAGREVANERCNGAHQYTNHRDWLNSYGGSNLRLCEAINRISRGNERGILRAIRRLHTIAAWCEDRSSGLKRCRDETRRQQSKWVDGLMAEHTMLAIANPEKVGMAIASAQPMIFSRASYNGKILSFWPGESAAEIKRSVKEAQGQYSKPDIASVGFDILEMKRLLREMCKHRGVWLPPGTI